MADQFVAEIRLFPFSFAPSGWAFCNGQLLPISQNTALFSLLGTMYGGDGKSTFALPNLQGNVAMHHGQGQGLSERFQGEEGGTETVTLLESEIPFHTHMVQVATEPAELRLPGPQRILTDSTSGTAYGPAAGTKATMAVETIGLAGGSLPHNNLMPYLVLNYCIALQGIFPSRG
jgi:microcystin-dependent protein